MQIAFGNQCIIPQTDSSDSASTITEDVSGTSLLLAYKLNDTQGAAIRDYRALPGYWLLSKHVPFSFFYIAMSRASPKQETYIGKIQIFCVTSSEYYAMHCMSC